MQFGAVLAVLLIMSVKHTPPTVFVLLYFCISPWEWRSYFLCPLYVAPPSQHVGSTGVRASPVVSGALHTAGIGDHFSWEWLCCKVNRDEINMPKTIKKKVNRKHATFFFFFFFIVKHVTFRTTQYGE
jgi:hypothetical protein